MEKKIIPHIIGRLNTANDPITVIAAFLFANALVDCFVICLRMPMKIMTYIVDIVRKQTATLYHINNWASKSSIDNSKKIFIQC